MARSVYTSSTCEKMPDVIGWLASQLPTSSTWLVILKYFGLVLAAGASIWGTVSVLAISDEGGRKHLTVGGRVAIGLTVTGLIVSIVFEDLQRRHAAIVARDQIVAEAKRTNEIIIAGQPLTSLAVYWKLWGLHPALAKLLANGNSNATTFIEDQQGERDDQQNSAVFREYQLYPFLLALARRFVGESAVDRNDNVVVLIALDDDPNAVLPFGHLSDIAPWGNTSPGDSAISNPNIELGSNADLGDNALKEWPRLSVIPGQAEIVWRAGPTTFAKSINRQNDSIALTAKLPKALRIAILFDIASLPFEPRNFAKPVDDDFWKFPDYDDTENDDPRGRLAPITNQFGSSVSLVPNNSADIAYVYRLKQVYETLFRDSYGEARSGVRAIVFEYSLQQ